MQAWRNFAAPHMFDMLARNFSATQHYQPLGRRFFGGLVEWLVVPSVEVKCGFIEDA